MIKCYTRIKKYVEESGLNIPEERLKEFAFMLDQQKAGSLTGAEFAEKAKAMIDDHLSRLFQKNRIVKAMYLAQREATLQKINDKTFGKSPAENMRSWLEGGAIHPGDSTNIDPRVLKNTIEADLLKTFRRGMEPMKEVAAKGALDRETFQELWAIDQVQPLGKSGSPMAVDVAKVVQAVNNQIFALKKAYNPFMERTTEYLMKRIWSREVVGAADKSTWVQDMMEHAGDRSFPELKAPEKEIIFGSIYDRIKDGSYGSVTDDAESDKFITLMGPGANIMKTMSRARSIVMNDADSAFKMNLKYGYGTVAETMDNVIRNSARDIAQIQKFSANPRAFYETTYARVLAAASDADKIELKDQKKFLDRSFQTAMGDFDAPGKNTVAKVARAITQAEYLAKTGSALIRSQLDIANTAMLMRGLNGKNLAQNAAEIVTEYAKHMASSAAALGDTSHLTNALEDLWMYSNASRGALLERLGSPGESPGAVAKLSELQGRASGMQAHVDALRLGTGTVVARMLGRMADIPHAELPGTFKQGLLRYGISEHEWNTLRQGTQDWGAIEDGLPPAKRPMLDATGVDQIPDEDIQAYLNRTGKAVAEASDEAIFLERKRLSYMLGTMINEHADYGVAHAGTRQRAFMLQGTTADSWNGTLLRMAGQFKTAASVQTDLIRRGASSGVDSSGSPTGDWAGTAQHLSMLCLIGALGIYAKDILNGKTLEDPRTLEFTGKMLIQSGAAGLVGDSAVNMLGKKSVNDRVLELAKAAAGPGLTDLAQGVGVGLGYARSTVTGDKPPQKELGNLGLGLIPGQNLFWSQAAFNHYFAHGLKEFLGPGYLGKLESNVGNTPGLLENRQRYFMMKPSESFQWPKAIQRANPLR